MSRTAIDSSTKENQGNEDGTFYQPKGSKNSHRLGDTRGQNPKGSEDLASPLFQFEMKFDSLKNYVDSVTTAVNQHASLLNKLRGEVNLRVAEKSLAETIKQFADCITIKDLDPSFMITAVNDNDNSKEEEGSLKSSVASFCSKLEIFGNGFSKVNKISQTINGKMQEMENSLGKKLSSADVKEKMKKAKAKLRGEMENNNKKLEEKMKAMEKRYQEKYEILERRVNSIAQEKSSGSENVEEILKKIDLSTIEEKISKEMNKVIVQGNEARQDELVRLANKIQEIEEGMTKEILETKKTVDGLSSNIMMNKQEDLEKEILKHLKSFEGPIEESCSQLKQEVEAIKTSIRNLENIENSKKENGLNSEIKKLSELQESMLWAKTEIYKLNEKMNELSNTVKDKIEYGELDSQFKMKTEKTEHLDLTDIINAEEEKYKKINKTIEDLELKVDKVNQNFDRKAAKLKKEFDLDSLIKQFKNKADEGAVQKNFESVESKIAGLSDHLVLLKRELDFIAKGNHHSSRQNDSAFISIKSALPKACLSCGNGPIHQGNNSFAIKKHEKPQLREKDTSVDRPSTGTNLKMKLFSGANILPNATSTQGFGLTPLRIAVPRQDSLK